MSYASAVNIISACISVISVPISFIALFISKASLSQAKTVADRDLKDWRQTKWFDLYLSANEAYDELDRFQALYCDTPYEENISTPAFVTDWNNLNRLIRLAHAMAGVFPINKIVTQLFDNTTLSADRTEACSKIFSKEYKKNFFDAVDDLRLSALVDGSILIDHS